MEFNHHIIVISQNVQVVHCSGIELQIYNMGQQLCYPIPAIVPGDLQEYAMLGGVNISFKCAVKDVNFLVNHEGLDSIDEQFEMRHEKDTSILISIAQKLQKAGDHQTALSLLKDWSVSSFFLGMPGAFKHVKDYLVRSRRIPRKLIILESNTSIMSFPGIRRGPNGIRWLSLRRFCTH